MNETYESCEALYDNSTDELGAIVRHLVKMPDVYGVKISGAGWGGALLVLGDSNRSSEIRSSVTSFCLTQLNKRPSFWEIRLDDGAASFVVS